MAKVLVRFNEIFLKSDPVAKSMKNLLAANIQAALNKKGLIHKLTITRHRLILDADKAVEAAEAAANVFGVSSTSHALETSSELGDLKIFVGDYAGEVLGGGSFAVRVKRQKDYPLTSVELERMLGRLIQKRYGNPVNLTEPETTVRVEIWGDKAYVYSGRIKGVGGLPYGSQGLLLGVLEKQGDVDAILMMMKRGAKVIVAAKTGLEESTKILEEYTPGELEVTTLDEGSQAQITDIIQERGCLGVILGVGADSLNETLEDKWLWSLGVPAYLPKTGVKASPA